MTKREQATLRRAAEASLKKRRASDMVSVDGLDVRRLVHELQVHQIELEMQNNELQQSRSELEATLGRYTQLYDAAPVGYLTLTADGLISKINLTGAKLLGVERADLQQRRFASFVVPEVREHWNQHFLQAKKHNKPGKVELALQRDDGTRLHVQVDYVRHKFGTDRTEIGSEENTLGAWITLTDITELKNFEAELYEARIIAEKANRAKSEFLSSMSHELRTPLSAIIGFAQLIESGSPTPTATQQRSIDQILQAGWYLLELINEILDLALIESGKLTLSLEPVGLTEVLSECQTMTEPQAQKRGISVSFTPFEAQTLVQADRIRLKQVLINLLANAIKYNKPNGTVAINCRTSTAGRLRIEVRDSGKGMGPERLAQLFQPFNRLGQEDSGKEGTGIGLVLSKCLVELMGGVIGVESAVGKGSIFWIELNLAVKQQPAAGADEASASGATSLQNAAPLGTLLYVEDSLAHLMLVEDLIARRPDIRLLSARDGEQGIEMARAYRPEVILMDINLPGMSGIKALEILAEDPATANIPVIALSANAIPSDIKKGLAAGFFCYLTKPIKVAEFMDNLDVALIFARAQSARAAKKEKS
ncbi:MAG: hypothetical protein H6R18_1698 [Proteobacteria bacterium]|nr:hypothetical protein [Pseudomonadota bacterium]